uniref:WSC domain-containing protein 1-like n=1 Tax=Phallusia mammillata TaxID=59560 RepID=A0A6F9DX75_9ASCI|nr:WSC domain-containing protein 1-like [Phallusia mammillata]
MNVFRLRQTRFLFLLCLVGYGVVYATVKNIHWKKSHELTNVGRAAKGVVMMDEVILQNPTIPSQKILQTPVETSFTTSKQSSTSVEAVEPEIKGTFCEFIDLGCFQPLMFSSKSGIGLIITNMTQNKCAMHCHNTKNSYAGLTKGDTCFCHFDVGGLVNIRLASDECKVPCQGKSDENCGGAKDIRALRIKSGCIPAPFKDSLVDSRSIGCFSTPSSDSGFSKHRAMTATRCTERCEFMRLPVAAFKSPDQCFCGKMTDRFNLTHKLSNCEIVDAVQAYRTLVEDKRCGNIKILPRGNYVRTWLGSCPGSGNTWTRYLLEKATGYYGGSAYGERIMHLSGFLGEMFPIGEGRTDFVKNHLMDPKRPDLQQVVLVIRNPYNAFISDFHRVSTKGNHTGRADRKTFDLNFLKYVQSTINYWMRMPENLLESKKPFLIIFYEHLVEDPITNVRKMVEFFPNKLLHPADLESRLACLSQELKGSYKRKSAKLTFNPYTSEMTKAMNEAIAYARRTLIEAGVKPVMPDYETAGPDVDVTVT